MPFPHGSRDIQSISETHIFSTEPLWVNAAWSRYPDIWQWKPTFPIKADLHTMFTSQSGMWLSACIFGRRQKLWTPTSSSPTPSLPFSQMFCNFSINALPENATSIVITINPDALSTQVSVYWIVGLAGFVTIIISLSRIIHNLDSESSSESESEQPPSPREKLRSLSWRKLMRGTLQWLEAILLMWLPLLSPFGIAITSPTPTPTAPPGARTDHGGSVV